MKVLFNIDWIEVFCLEPLSGVVLNADYFRNTGYEVDQRAYGTRVYQEMFKLKIGAIWAIEIRRNPHPAKNGKQVMDPRSVHIRLTNEACYMRNPIELITTFIERHAYKYQGISRIDLCADFTHFVDGQRPVTVVDKIMKKQIMRVKKGNFSIHGKEFWGGQDVQTLSWGSNNSMVTTKMYNKSQEMKDVKPKVYIQNQWLKSGLVESLDNDDVWRVEFSVKSRCKKWVKLENSNGKGNKAKYAKHSLELYSTKEGIAQFFYSLSEFYFKFRVTEYTSNGDLQRKARCKDYKLFDYSADILKPVTEVEISQPTKTEKVLLNYLDKLKDDNRGFWDVRWQECIATFKQIIGERKLTKEIRFREQLYERMFDERCTYEYVDFYNSLIDRTIFVKEPEYDRLE